MLHQQRCLNHAGREAVARCPSCSQFYCRECVTEHEDRVICASCLRKAAAHADKPKRSFTAIKRLLAGGCGFLVAWMVFYLGGRVLLSIPAEFHDGSVWERSVFDEE